MTGEEFARVGPTLALGAVDLQRYAALVPRRRAH